MTDTLKGAGIWLRRTHDIKPEIAAEHLRFVVVALTRGAHIRTVGPSLRAWCEEYRCRGGTLWGMDWLPPADRSHRHLDTVATNALKLGCVGIMGDHEPEAGWRGAAASAGRYAALVQQEVTGRGLQYAVTDYARGGMDPTTMTRLLSVADYGVPQSYDPDGRYAVGYHEKSARHWEKRGAKRVVMGLGLWLRGEKRHRTVDEMRRHLEGIPDRVTGVCAWYAPRRRPNHSRLAAVVPVLAEWARDRDAVVCPNDG